MPFVSCALATSERARIADIFAISKCNIAILIISLFPHFETTARLLPKRQITSGASFSLFRSMAGTVALDGDRLVDNPLLGQPFYSGVAY